MAATFDADSSTKARPLRVLLVRPPGHFSSLIYPDGPWVGVPLGLLYLATAARKVAGVEVRILDALARPDFQAIERAEPPVLFGLSAQAIAAEAEAFGAQVVGVTVAAETFYADALATAAAVRERLPGALIVAGGTDVSMQPDRYLKDSKALDALVVGEGERALEQLLTRLQTGEDWRGTRGLVVRGDGEALRRNEPPPLIEDLDENPPAWGDLDLEPYFELNRRGFPSRQSVDYPGSDRAVFLFTSRGCPYRCSFCSIHLTMGRAFRPHSVEYLVRQMTELARTRGVRHFHIEDDHLTLDRDRLKALLQGLVDAGLDITWDTPNGVRADRFDAELIDLCKRAGCVYLMFGIESASQTVLDDLVHKELDLAAVERTLALCHQAGLDNMALFIFGLPGETKQTVLQTYEYAFSLFRRFGTVPFVSLYKPYPGTELYSTCEKNGWLVDARPYERMGKIPYTLFMPTMVETPQLEIWFLVDLYSRYMLRFAVRVMWNATRFLWRHPLLVARLTVRTLGRLIRAPSRAMPTLRAHFWRTLLFPRAQVRLARRPGGAPKSVSA